MKNLKNIFSQSFIKIILLILTFNATSQTRDEKKFLRFYNAQSLAGKVKSFDTLNNSSKIKFYPLIKNDLEQIREKAILDNQTDIIDRLTKIEAEIYFLNKNYSKAIPLLTDLLERNKIKDYKDSAAVLFYLKNAYVNIHSLKKAIDIHKILMNIRKYHSDVNEWQFHPKLSIIYYEMKLYNECLNQQLREYEEIKGNSQMVLGYFNNRGLFWQKYGQLDSALICFKPQKKCKPFDLHLYYLLSWI